MDASREDKYKRLVEATGGFSFQSIDNVNHNTPHPFTIGPRHIEPASERHGWYAWRRRLQSCALCAHPGCRMPYDQHTWNTVLFLSLKRDMTNAEANEELKAVSVDMLADGIDGFVLVETEEKFRIE